MTANLTAAQIDRVLTQLSPEARCFVSRPVLEYAAQKLCPDVFLMNVGREYAAKRLDGATAAAGAYQQAARLVAGEIG